MPRAATLLQEEASPRLTRTRKALIEAGQRLISAGRMNAATIDDIVREADVAKGSFYNHFPDRDALVQHVLSSVKTELEDLIARANEGVDDAPTYFARGMVSALVYGLMNNVSASVLIYVTSGVTDPLNQHNTEIVRWLRKGMDDGSLKLVNVDTGLVLLLGLSDMALARLLELQFDRPRAREVIHGVCSVALRGLGVDARKVERITEAAITAVVGVTGQPSISLR